MAHSYESAVVRIEDLPEDTIRTMAALYLKNFDGSSESIFRSDLAEKNEVILLNCKEQLVGFTTLKIFEVTWHSRPVRIVYSGDTIVSPLHWGQQELAFAWISRIGEIKHSAPALPLFWFLLVKGHRTFKYLSVFGKSFFPHWSVDREDLKSLADQLASAKFGSDYDPETGVVRFPTSRGHLKAAIADATPEEMTKAATQYFFQKNPGYRMGHELVCICELELFNMKPLTARIFKRAGEAIIHVR
jgi:hypothetical protein